MQTILQRHLHSSRLPVLFHPRFLVFLSSYLIFIFSLKLLLYLKLRLFSSFVFFLPPPAFPYIFPQSKQKPSNAPSISSQTTPSWADVLICWKTENSTEGSRQAGLMDWGQLYEEIVKIS